MRVKAALEGFVLHLIDCAVALGDLLLSKHIPNHTRRHPSVVEDPLRHVPYSNSSIVFVPPGVIVVSDVGNVFTQENISLSNSAINGMESERCLHVHNLFHEKMAA